MLDIPFIVRELVLFLLIALVAILLTRRLRVPYTLGLVMVGLLLSLMGLLPEAQLTPSLVLFVFLPALLFEGSWTIKLSRLRENWRAIFLLAGPGVLLSLILIAVILHFFDGLSWETALLLAAILSPTDPVAVLGLFRQMKVDERLSTIIEGESLFNDGVAGSLYQTFLAIVLLSLQGESALSLKSWLTGLGLFVLEAGGGILIGAISGWGVGNIVKRIDDPLIETTITVIVAYGVYMLADLAHSSPIMAVIVAGLVLSHIGRSMGMAERTLETVDNFWSVLAFIANALIFLLMGIQLNPSSFFSSPGRILNTLFISLLAVAVVLLARLLLVLLLVLRGQYFRPGIPRPWGLIVFWSGLRGALSLALVLAIPLEVPGREVLIISTYAVVFFTLLVQGFSLRLVLKGVPSATETQEVEEKTTGTEEINHPSQESEAQA